LDFEVIDNICSVIAQCAKEGVEVGVVVGGGNFWRGLKDGKGMHERTRADHMGMLATTINALGLCDALEQLGCDVRVQTAIAMNQIAEPYIRNRAVRHLEKGRVVIFGCGTGNPFFSTDTAAALRACEINAEVVMKATSVDGVYTADPKTDPTATRFDAISYEECISRELKVMDQTAFTLCKDNAKPIMVFDMHQPGNITRALLGEQIGTIIGG
jgi:uridylate kinase